MTTVADLGEFGLIARLTAGLPHYSGVITGVGDDAAVLDIGGDQLLIATCDAQVEGTHFRLQTTSPHALGRRILAINLSDMAAMGAKPRFVLVSLLLPSTLDITLLEGIYAGLRDEATRFDTTIVGGNVARNAERLILDITLLGTAARKKLLQRGNAKAGEVVMVTGSLGMAAAGLLVLEDEQLAARLDPASLARPLAAQLTPTPQVAAGLWLAEHGVTTGIDVSDGLAADIAHICEASGVGVRLEAALLPIEPEVVTIATLAGRKPHDLALFGGEDYQLLFTVSPEYADALPDELFAATGVRATAIGTMCEEPALTLVQQGQSSPLPVRGWDHLRPSSTS